MPRRNRNAQRSYPPTRWTDPPERQPSYEELARRLVRLKRCSPAILTKPWLP